MSEFTDAREIMALELKADAGLYKAYQANVAMLLHDRHGIRNVEKRNRAAAEILSLIFNISLGDSQ